MCSSDLGEPYAARDHHVREAGRHEKGDALLVEIAAPLRQLRGDARRGLREVVIREQAVGGDDGEAVGGDRPF